MKKVMRCGALMTVVLGVAWSGAAAAQAGGYDWQLRINEGRVSDAVLAYEVPDTDDQLIALTCEQGGARIFASTAGVSPRLRVLGLKSGAEALVVGGVTEYAEELDYHYFTSREMDAKSGLFDVLATSGTMTLLVDGEETAMKGNAKSLASIRKFVSFCRG